MSISLKEYVARRERVFKSLKGAAAVVFAGEESATLLGKWKTNRLFWYLTGIQNESGAAILFDPSAENPKHQIVLFLRPLNPEVERWDGLREEISPRLREQLGFSAIIRNSSLPAFLTGAARRAKKLACVHPFSVYPSAVSPDLEAYRKVSERVPGVEIQDRSQLLYEMRAIKSQAELDLMKQAVTATDAGFDAAMKMIKPGVNEALIERTMEDAFRAHGGTGLAYNSIVGAGVNGTVLHYSANNTVVGPDDLIVIDAAAEVEGYCADVTRTFPASGKFTAEQREIYEIVLASELAGIKAARPGAHMVREVDKASRDVIEKAGYGHTFIHGIGHQLGIDVHDVTPDGTLKPGMVVTIEPGIYLPEKKFGVRIEDDILITANGSVNLTGMIPKTIKAVEAAMAR